MLSEEVQRIIASSIKKQQKGNMRHNLKQLERDLSMKQQLDEDTNSELDYPVNRSMSGEDKKKSSKAKSKTSSKRKGTKSKRDKPNKAAKEDNLDIDFNAGRVSADLVIETYTKKASLANAKRKLPTRSGVDAGLSRIVR